MHLLGAESVLYGLSLHLTNNPPLLLWRFPSVAPWLVVSFDDIIGISMISKADVSFTNI